MPLLVLDLAYLLGNFSSCQSHIGTLKPLGCILSQNPIFYHVIRTIGSIPWMTVASKKFPLNELQPEILTNSTTLCSPKKKQANQGPPVSYTVTAIS